MSFITFIKQAVCQHKKAFVKNTEEYKIVKGIKFGRYIKHYTCVSCGAESTKLCDWYRSYRDE